MKNKILIIINVILVLVIMILVGFLLKSNKDSESIKNNKDLTITDKEKEYYSSMHKKMSAYYEVMFKHIKLPEDKKYNKVQISLGSLEREGFPIDEFINYETKEPCDTARSYAIRKLVNSKYEIDVYYKCGTVANYDYRETSK